MGENYFCFLNWTEGCGYYILERDLFSPCNDCHSLSHTMMFASLPNNILQTRMKISSARANYFYLAHNQSWQLFMTTMYSRATELD